MIDLRAAGGITRRTAASASSSTAPAAAACWRAWRRRQTGFPLSVHASVQWCKKVRGKVYYFGTLDDPDGALVYLRRWTEDPDEHVRRLVSEGTRPRLPWGARLRRFGISMLTSLRLFTRAP